MHLNNFFCDRQTQASAAFGSREIILDLVKLFKYFFLMLLGNAGPFVLYPELPRLCSAERTERNGAFLWAELDGVAQQIYKYLFELGFVNNNGKLLWHGIFNAELFLFNQLLICLILKQCGKICFR